MILIIIIYETRDNFNLISSKTKVITSNFTQKTNQVDVKNWLLRFTKVTVVSRRSYHRTTRHKKKKLVCSLERTYTAEHYKSKDLDDNVPNEEGSYGTKLSFIGVVYTRWLSVCIWGFFCLAYKNMN